MRVFNGDSLIMCSTCLSRNDYVMQLYIIHSTRHFFLRQNSIETLAASMHIGNETNEKRMRDISAIVRQRLYIAMKNAQCYNTCSLRCYVFFFVPIKLL